MPTKKTPARVTVSASVKSAPKAKAKAKPSAKPAPAKTKTAAKPAVKVEVRNLPSEHDIAHGALKLVDQAAALLRKGISTGANTSQKARITAAKKAQDLLTEGTAALQKILGKFTK